ncbi:MAG: ATP-binding protein [Alphaproteobacteria bacterium]
MSMDNRFGQSPQRDRNLRPISFFQRIAARQAGYVVAAVCVVGLLLTIAQIVEDYFDHRAEIGHSAQQLLATVRQPAAQAAFMVDKSLAREVASGLFAHEAVVEVVITTDFGEPLAAIQRPPRESSWLAELLFSEKQAITLPLTVNPESPSEVGNVAITLDPLISGEAFLVRAKRAIVYGIVRAAVLSVIIAAIFYQTLTKPLLTLVRAFGAINPRRPDAVAIEPPRGHERDEIGHLVDAANSLLANVEKNRQRLQLSRSEADRLRRRAEAASQAKTRFLATMSHELRTPLNAILGFSEMIRDEIIGKVGNPKYRDYARDIHASGRHLLHLIGEILDISKIEAGKMELAPRVLSLQRLLHGMVRVIEMRAIDNQLRLVTEIPDELPAIWADEQAIKQVVLNLLSNAVKFTPAGGTITVSAEAQDGFAVVRVADTGIGMSEADLERVFQPFEQADNRYQLSDETRGTGLGLALAQRLVAMHNGRVTIQSAPKQGTTVSFELPLADHQDEDHPPTEAPAAPRQTAMMLAAPDGLGEKPGRTAAEQEAA